MKNIIFKLSAVLFGITCLSSSYASEMVYTPVNPNFGGNPGNGGFLLQQAANNNHFKGHKYNTPQLTSEQLLQQTIKNSLYSQIAGRISTELGNGSTSGSFMIGSSTIFYSDDGTNTTITIVNSQGGSTTFTVPNGI